MNETNQQKDIIIISSNDEKLIYEFKNYGKMKKIKILGEGSFGKVLLVEEVNPKNINCPKKYALKKSKRYVTEEKNAENANTKSNNTPKELNFIELRELFIMKKTLHKNLIYSLDFNIPKSRNEIWILMDYVSTDLHKFFKENKNNSKIMNEKFLKNIFYQIINGVNFLHSKKIIHRDLKPENILYDIEKNLIRISDFGLSRQFQFDLNCIFTDAGTYPYKPLDVILGNYKYGTSFDVWSIGCIFVEIVTGEHLFGDKTEIGVLKLIYEIFGNINDEKLPLIKSFSKYDMIKDFPEKKGKGIINYVKEKSKVTFENDNFYDLIEKLLILDPVKRISMKKCLEHPWFISENLIN